MIHPFILSLASGIIILLLACVISFYKEIKTNMRNKWEGIQEKRKMKKIIKAEKEAERSLAFSRKTIFESETEFEGTHPDYSSQVRMPVI